MRLLKRAHLAVVSTLSLSPCFILSPMSSMPFTVVVGVLCPEIGFYPCHILGSLILEMGALSRLTGDPRFESAALHALRKLWSMRSSLNLLGTTLDVVTGEWIEHSSGIGAGMCFILLASLHKLFIRLLWSI